MATTDYIKKAYCEALLSLCNEKSLNCISVADVVAKAGTARQTYYNRFRDINDLICFIPINYIEICLSTETNLKGALYKAFRYVLENKSFFCQLPFHNTQNSFRDSFFAWGLKTNCGKNAFNESDDKYIEKQLSIYLYCAGVAELFLEWCRRKMDWPIEVIIKIILKNRPPFIVD